MNHLPWGRAVLMALCLGPVAVAAVAATDLADVSAGNAAAERQAIAQERARLAQRHEEARAACYQRFVVDDCLQRARGEFRAADAVLRARELEVNDAERRAKAAAREAQIEQRRNEAAEAATAPPRSAVRTPPDPASAAQREQQAQERARLQQDRTAEHEREQQARTQERTTRAQRARERQAEREEAFESRRQRRAEREQADTAGGRQPAAPLPAPAR